MSNAIINTDLLKKVMQFLKENRSLNYLDPDIFKNIDEHKEIIDVSFNDYYLEYIKKLPKLDFETAVRISREVYQQYGMENEFDRIFEWLRNNYGIDNGSLNKDDDNCIINASDSRVLLSGTYYDVVLLCHEIGHKLRSGNSLYSSLEQDDVMDAFFFETPSIVFELAANNLLKENYGVDIRADEMRKLHVLSINREEHDVFSIIIDLLKKRRLNAINLYIELIKNQTVVEHFKRKGSSIRSSFEEGLFSYSYDIGYILGNYINNNEGKIEKLNTILNYKYNGITMPFTIDESIISASLGNLELLGVQNRLHK